MRNLSTLLSRLTQALNKDADTKQAIIGVVKDSTRVSLEEKNISIKNHVLEISAGSAAKSEIRMKEEEITNRLKERGIFVSRFLYK